MAKLIFRIWSRVGRSGDEPQTGDVDPYLVQLVRRSAVLRAQADQP